MTKESIWTRLRVWAAFFVGPNLSCIISVPGKAWVKEPRIFVQYPYAQNITWVGQEYTEWAEKRLKENTEQN